MIKSDFQIFVPNAFKVMQKYPKQKSAYKRGSEFWNTTGILHLNSLGTWNFLDKPHIILISGTKVKLNFK